jgi:transcriptional antiterminator RfaH
VVVERGKPQVLFPSYLFVFSCEINLRWLCSTVAVVAPVRMGTELAIVSDGLIDALRQREIDGVVQLDSAPRFVPGQRVRVTDGPFRSLSGLYEGMHPGERVCVLISILGRETRVVLPGEAMIEAA